MKNIAILILSFLISGILLGQNINHTRKEILPFYYTTTDTIDNIKLFTKIDSSQEKVSYRCNFNKWRAKTSFYFDKNDVCYKQEESDYPTNLGRYLRKIHTDTIHFVSCKEDTAYSIYGDTYSFFEIMIRVKKQRNKYQFFYSVTK